MIRDDSDSEIYNSRRVDVGCRHKPTSADQVRDFAKQEYKMSEDTKHIKTELAEEYARKKLVVEALGSVNISGRSVEELIVIEAQITIARLEMNEAYNNLVVHFN